MGEKGGDEGALLWGVDAFEYMVPSQSDGVVVASALVGALGATRLSKWRAEEGNRRMAGRWMQARITHYMRARFGWGVIISPGAEAPTGAH